MLLTFNGYLSSRWFRAHFLRKGFLAMKLETSIGIDSEISGFRKVLELPNGFVGETNCDQKGRKTEQCDLCRGSPGTFFFDFDTAPAGRIIEMVRKVQ